MSNRGHQLLALLLAVMVWDWPNEAAAQEKGSEKPAKRPTVEGKDLGEIVVQRDIADLKRILEDGAVREKIKDHYPTVEPERLKEALWFDLRSGKNSIPVDKPLTVQAALKAMNGERVVIHYTSKTSAVSVTVDGGDKIETDQSCFTPKGKDVEIRGKKDGYNDYASTHKFDKNGAFEVVMRK